ncbi:hypothetical protein F0L68_31715 [Solihabitans fulvus]|uniref:Uncharacterized protein n=1 Tax=Solihabitans fulvus TaxID=1892852 RepID=A0A5B2WSC6_9PSEU|nr:hypothetical protein [Solihabitans fulvus]KAA2253848.1 hypothetical protein F0L68_31715 [Solihabitans fulvus]
MTQHDVTHDVSLRQALLRHRPLLVLFTFAVLQAAMSVVGLAVDDRVVTGAPVWLKPFKFGVSVAIYAVSLAWLLARQTRHRRLGWWMGTAVSVFIVVEFVLLLTQVFRGRASHFNVATAFDSALFQIMGASIGVVWLCTAVIAALVWRQRLGDRADTAAARLGLVIALIGLGLAFLMVGPTPGQRAGFARGVHDAIGAHTVGAADGGPGMPVTGWSTTSGDLRIPHFFGIHALQALPLLAVLLRALARRGGRFAPLRREEVRLRLVVTSAAGYAGAVALVTWQALRGQSLVHPDGWTLGVAALLLAGTAAAAAAALRTRVVVPATLPAAMIEVS